ncbi:substrate-binding periplasmic protein [Nitrincola alkalilacustris]|uniref:substrate-binding periplasmic protein n=1 Tax=Nitrincola alkalilacustris TaxID=1571224 RepID=UPI00124DED4C|nr:transporter substrate-binding domain-containing protein [Nitrincola alkalilacustris]
MLIATIAEYFKHSIKCHSVLWSFMVLTTLSYNTLANEYYFYTEEYPPFSYTEGESVKGINTELLTRAMISLKQPVGFYIVPWGRAQELTQQQSNSCLFSAARTEERENLYQWVGPLSTEHIVLYAMAGNPIELDNLADANRYVVGGQTADAYSDWIENLGIEIHRTTEIPTNLMMLAHGRIDLWLAGSIGGPYIATQMDIPLRPVQQTEETFHLWLACNKAISASLISDLNHKLKQFRADGTLDEIVDRYQ